MNASEIYPAKELKSAPRPYFAALDGFRGVLALVVAMYHTIWLSHPNTSAFFNNGPVIIDLFFAFSGFLMFTLYMQGLETRSQIKGFMIKRLARLYPLHLFMLAVFVAFAVFRIWAHKVGLAFYEPGEILPFQSGAPETWRNLAAHLTMTHAMGGADALTFNPPSWTIGAEFYTYTLFAIFMMLKPKRGFDFALVALGVIALYAYLSTRHDNLNITYQDGFLRCIAGFFIGVVVARLTILDSMKRFFDRLSALQSSFLECLTLIISIAFVIYCSGKMQFFVAPILVLFVLVFSQDKGVISRFMSQKLFGYLAKISYSVYMVHVIIAIVFAVFADKFIGGIWPDWNAKAFSGDLLMVPYLLTVIAVSHITYHLVEIPGGRFTRRLFNDNHKKKSLAKTTA